MKPKMIVPAFLLLMLLLAACSPASPATTAPTIPAATETPLPEPTAIPATSAPVYREELSPELIEAIRANDVAEVQRLLKAGADPNLETGGVYPVFMAVSLGNVEIVEQLLSYGGDVLLEIRGNSLLDVAQSKNNAEMALALLQFDAGFVAGEMTSPALANNLYDDPGTRSYLVYLPPSYSNGNDRYPVLYALHGGATQMIKAGDAPEMIIVFPNSQTVFGGSYASSIATGDNETYITQDLVNYIDANFRTITDRESRGIVGCAPGAAAAIKYAFTHPDVFSLAAGMSGLYDAQSDVLWIAAQNDFRGMPADLAGIKKLPFQLQVVLSFAAGAAPNPDNPPFFFDPPFEMVDGVSQIVPDVAEKTYATYTTSVIAQDIDTYLAKEEKLNGIFLYHADNSTSPLPIAHAYALSEILTGAGIEHEVYPDTTSQSCNNDEVILQFFIDHLAFEAAD
jgi:hypothetical protein